MGGSVGKSGLRSRHWRTCVWAATRFSHRSTASMSPGASPLVVSWHAGSRLTLGARSLGGAPPRDASYAVRCASGQGYASRFLPAPSHDDAVAVGEGSGHQMSPEDLRLFVRRHAGCTKKKGLRSVPLSPVSSWLRGLDLNQRPLGYEPNELPDCSTPRRHSTRTGLHCQAIVQCCEEPPHRKRLTAKAPPGLLHGTNVT